MDFAGLVQRDGQRLGRRLDVLDRLVPLQRPPLENRRLGSPPCFRLVGFQRQQQRLVGIAREGLEVLARGQRAEAQNKGVVARR